MTQEKALAQFVSELREKLGLSQTGLAKKSALPLKTIEDIEQVRAVSCFNNPPKAGQRIKAQTR